MIPSGPLDREAATLHPAGAVPYRAAPISSSRLKGLPLWWAVACALAVLWFGTLELRGLFAPDEGRYAQIPQAMLATGDWITPRLNGFKYFEKPPLQYWATAVVYKLFGEDEWTARLWPALVGFLGAGVIAWIGTVGAGRRVGGLAGFMLATSLGYFLAGQYLTLDMGLTFFLTCALAFFIKAQCAELPDPARIRWMLLAWSALACAVLSKGLVGIVLPGLALGVYMALARDFRLLRRLAAAPGVGVFLAITAPWFLLVQDRNPEFFRFFFIHEHFERFALPGHHRPGPWWYFIPVVLAGTLPWTPLVLRAALKAVRERGSVDRSLNIDLLLAISAATIFLFFSLSSSKLPAYVLPALPPLVLLAARRVGELDAKEFLRDTALGGALAAAAAGGACLLLARTDSFSQLAPAAPWFLLALSALLAGGAGAILLARRQNVGYAALLLGLAMPVVVQLAMAGAHAVDELHSTERVIESLFGEERPTTDTAPFYSVGTFDPSLPFYLGRPVVMVGYRSELGAGIAAEPYKFIDTVEEFSALWLARSDGYAAMTPRRFDEFERSGLPMRVLGRDSQRVIVSR